MDTNTVNIIITLLWWYLYVLSNTYNTESELKKNVAYKKMRVINIREISKQVWYNTMS